MGIILHRLWIFIVAMGLGCSSSSDLEQHKDTEQNRDPIKETTSKTDTSTTSDTSAGDSDVLQPVVRDEGSARPMGKVRREPVVPRPSFEHPLTDAMIKIEGGTLLEGSSPGDVLRTHFAEADLPPHEMTPFEMDALPYPNDPDRPFLTGVTRQEAQQFCAQNSKRLCTELEWEWACKSADNRRYPYGNIYDSSAYPESDPISPSSPFGVFAMGRILEWTSSSWGLDPDQVDRGVARGYTTEPDDPSGLKNETGASGRRCAKRWRRMPEIVSPAMGFRCCRGSVNKAACTIERTRPPIDSYNNMKPDKFARVIRSIPELAPVHSNPHMFSDGDVRAVLARRNNDRDALAKQGIHFRWKPMRWIPRQGTELWVAVGRSNRHSFVVALHETKDNEEYIHATSLILRDQPLPLAIAYQKGHRDELFWAPCWNCRDGGSIRFNDETNQVEITFKW